MGDKGVQAIPGVDYRKGRVYFCNACREDHQLSHQQAARALQRYARDEGYIMTLKGPQSLCLLELGRESDG